MAQTVVYMNVLIHLLYLGPPVSKPYIYVLRSFCKDGFKHMLKVKHVPNCFAELGPCWRKVK